ncbi:MAG: FadR family transcriptional regulator [Bauldia sp.]|nr:FadR family transcriptional regulator [Bauldia sp.]
MLTFSSSALFGASRKRNRFAAVVEELGSRIVQGEFRPGDPLPNEADLGREFGTSRSVIREAVKSLAAKGLLESRTRTGIRVLPASDWNLLDVDLLGWRYGTMEPQAFFRELFEIRRMIEPEASALAAERASPDEIAVIERAFSVMAQAEADRTTAAAVMADLDFHRAILTAAHNDLLLQMGKLIAVGLLVSYRISTGHYTLFLGRHKDVLSAIARRRPASARRMMERLLSETWDYLDTRFEAGKA